MNESATRLELGSCAPSWSATRASDMACIATMQHDHSVHISVVFLGETPSPEMCQTFWEAVTMADDVHLLCVGERVGCLRCHVRTLDGMSSCTMDELGDVWWKWLKALVEGEKLSGGARYKRKLK